MCGGIFRQMSGTCPPPWGVAAVSWVDLAALAVILWSAVSGYFAGVRGTVTRLAGLIPALLLAAFLSDSLVYYVNREWQAGAVLAGYLSGAAANVVSISGPGSDRYALLWQVRLRLAPGAALPVAARGDPAGQLAELLLWLLAFAALFLLGLAAVSVWRRRVIPGPERRKMAGFSLGLCFGTLLSVLCCLALNALCLLPWAGFLWEDLRVSYLLAASRALLNGPWW